MSYDIGTKFDFRKNKQPERTSRKLYDIGTRLYFDLAADGDYIVRRLIPIRYIGVA